MASFELTAFDAVREISLIAAIETPAKTLLQLGFWLNDPEQLVDWGNALAHHPRKDFLWQATCFELFIGIKNQDDYREINLSASLAWQAYQFEEYRYPEQIPPCIADDISLLELQRTKFGLTAILDIELFLSKYNVGMQDLYFGLAAVLDSANGKLFFAMQHSSPHADFHNKRDWLFNP